MPITHKTAEALAYAYREIEVAESLLADIDAAVARHEIPDIRDAFGRRRPGLQLGVPSGENSRQLFDVPWALARPIIETHIATQRAFIATLSEQARIELESPAARSNLDETHS